MIKNKGRPINTSNNLIGYKNKSGWRIIDKSFYTDKNGRTFWVLQSPEINTVTVTVRSDYVKSFSGKKINRVAIKNEISQIQWKSRSETIRMVRRQFVEFVFEGAELEGLGLTYAKTYEIVNDFESSKRKYSWLQIQAVKGMVDAYNEMNLALQNNLTINYKLLQKYNHLIDFYEETIWSGQWRDKNIGIGGSEYIPPVLTPKKYQDKINELSNIKPTFDNGLKIFAILCRTQCFNNGNKRTALVFANTFLLKNRLRPIMIKDHHILITQLVHFYETNNLDIFIKNVKKVLK